MGQSPPQGQRPTPSRRGGSRGSKSARNRARDPRPARRVDPEPVSAKRPFNSSLHFSRRYAVPSHPADRRATTLQSQHRCTCPVERVSSPTPRRKREPRGKGEKRHAGARSLRGRGRTRPDADPIPLAALRNLAGVHHSGDSAPCQRVVSTPGPRTPSTAQTPSPDISPGRSSDLVRYPG